MRPLMLLAVMLPGCAAFHPIKGVPASRLPCQFLGPSRDGLRTINPLLLTRSRPSEHLVGPGDVLAIYIPGILGAVSPDLQSVGETPPINYPQDPEMPPTIGFPITVRGDGMISLPQVPPIPVTGLTLAQTEEAIRRAYTEPKQILPDGRERVLVSLQRPREYRVLVVRQETASTQGSVQDQGQTNLGSTRRGTARIVRLKANENDVLHALARVEGADGLPGLDAENAIYVIRRRNTGNLSSAIPVGAMPTGPVHGGPMSAGPVYGGPMPQGMNPYGAAPQMTPMGASSMPYGSTVRFQSPEPSARGGSAYAGHSFAVRPTPSPYGGRYAAIPQPIPHPGPPAPMMAAAPNPMAVHPGSRYPVPPARSPEFAAAPQMAPVVTAMPQPSGRYAAPPAIRPVSHSMEPVPQEFSAYTLPAPALPPGAGPMMSQPMPGMPPMAAPAFPPPGAAMPPMVPGTPGVDVDSYFRSMMVSDIGATIDSPNVVKIPVRLADGEQPGFTEQDVILEDGDIVFIESRDSEVYYTGGLLGGGEYTLPRDRDLRVLEALSIAQAARQQNFNRGVGGVSALNQDVTISASKVIVLRRLADGSTLPIEVDLNKVKREMTGRENIVVQPGDFLILQYSCAEAVGAFIERHLLEGAIFTLAGSQFTGSGNK